VAFFRYLPVLLLAAFLAAGPAWAQETVEQETLEPPPVPSPAAAPAPPAPVLSSVPPFVAPPVAAPVAVPGAAGETSPTLTVPPFVQRAVGPDVRGVWDDRTGGLSPELFRDSPVENIQAGFDALTKKIVEEKNPPLALIDPARRLALTLAYNPQEKEGSGANDQLLLKRFRLALLGGRAVAGFFMVDKTSGLLGEADWVDLLNALLLQGKVDVACPALTRAGFAETNPYFQKFRLVCGIRATRLQEKPDFASLRLALDLLREGGEKDAVFFDAAERAMGGMEQRPLGADPTDAVQLAMLALSAAPISKDSLEELSLSPQPIHTMLNASLEWRLTAAFALAQNGRMDTSALEKMVERVSHENPLLDASSDSLPASFFATCRVMQGSDTQVVKAAVLSALVARLSNNDLLSPLGEVLVKLSNDIAPLPDREAEALTFARLQLLQEGKAVSAWWGLAVASPQGRVDAVTLFPLALIRGLIPEETVPEWAAAYAQSSVPAEARQLNILLARVLGVEIPKEVQPVLLGDNTALLDSVMTNPSATRAGETLLGLLLKQEDTANVLEAVRVMLALQQKKGAEIMALTHLRDQ
jgi:hypothetical protein